MPHPSPPSAGESEAPLDDDGDQALAALAAAYAHVQRVLNRRRGARGDVLIATADLNLSAALRTLLAARGWRGFCVVSGAEAAVSTAARLFDLILLDVDAPADGYAGARRIRALPHPHGSAPLLALTAHANSALRDAAAEAEMDGFLEKPVAPDKLDEALRLLTEPSVRAAELDSVQDQDRDDEGADGDERGRDHAFSPERANR